MTHDPSRLATAEQIINGNNPFELIDVEPFGKMERWRAEALIIGTTSGIVDVYRTIRDDAASQAARADADEARNALTAHLCDQITELSRRFDALEARFTEAEDRRRADEQAQREFDEEPLELPPTDTPTPIRDDEPPVELKSKEPEPSLIDDNIGDLPPGIEDPPDPVPEPKGSVYPQPVSISLNKE